MIEEMLPYEERRVLQLARIVVHLELLIGDVEGENRGHLNLPSRVAEKYRTEYRKFRSDFDSARNALRKAIRLAEHVSPGCSANLIAEARQKGSRF